MVENNYDEQGLCPNCGSEDISINDHKHDGELLIFSCTCEECHTDFYEICRVEFSSNQIIQGV